MKVENYKDNYNKITRTLMEKLQEEKKGENIVFSPMSIIMLLGAAADATSGIARDEILEVIGSGVSYDDFVNIMTQLQADIKSSKSLMSSNAVCVNASIKDSIKEGYKDRLNEIFDGKLFSSKDIVGDVNAWVKKKTRGMIESIADESMNNMLACLMNAIVFEAQWLNQYEEWDIDEGDFTNADGSASKVWMLDSSEDRYIEDNFFTGFLKPYKDKKYAFMALLPKKKKSNSFLNRAFGQINFTELMASSSYEEVDVSMPEFKYDFGDNMTILCKELGIQTLFTLDADFSPMSTEPLLVESIIHKAHIEVDRKGTKAAAVTAEVFVGCAPKPDLKTVYLDRPFIYAIMDVDSELPVFCGIFNHAEDIND